jgi:hypothetical protein
MLRFKVFVHLFQKVAGFGAEPRVSAFLFCEFSSLLENVLFSLRL